jgi:hypothetical protein
VRSLYSSLCNRAAAQPRNEYKINGLDEKQPAQQSYGCADANFSNRLNLNDLRGCADENPESGARAQSSGNVPDEKPSDPRIGRIELQSRATVGDAWEDGF